MDRKIKEAVSRQREGDLANDPQPPGRSPAPEPAQPSGRKSFGETLDHEIGAIKDAWNGLKIGEGHLKGMFKLGAHELTQALAALPDSNIRPLEEPGVVFNETMPHIVNDFEAELQQYSNRTPSNDKDRGFSR